jgi:subtilase family serine protease
MTGFVKVRSVAVATLIVAGWCWVALGQAPANRVVRAVDEAQVVTLLGNVHPLARSEFDMGSLSAETPMERMMLTLEPSAEQQAALDALVEAQHDPQSPLFHQWLTPAEYGARFGASAADMAKVASWLTSHGFQIEEIPAGNRLVIFSGTAQQVEDTFHTAMHRYQVNGVEHIANAQDPQIPAAFEGVVGGVVSLHDFRRNSQISSRRALASQPEYTSGSTHYLFPADWATIYDLKSLYSAGTTGAGISIAIVGRSNINVSDVTGFRSLAGLSVNPPTVLLVSTNPGLLSGDQDESTLDVEWSGAVAPSASVKFVVGASTATSDGVDLSAQYIVNHNTAPVVSTSYGSCEKDMGTVELAFYNSLWQQAASEGMSSFVSSGDAGAAGCNVGTDATGSGAAVNGLCSSPYSTCVGGTEFNEGSNSATYWSSTNTSANGSALSYIPEKVWNESASDGGTGLWASTGGVSLVYPAPSWQKGVSGTSAANGMRAVPDVAMAAAGHDGYIVEENGSYWVFSGTSAASPTFAGVMALLVQSKGGTGQGNANAGLYPLLSAAHNPFHATPSGNNSVPGVAGFSASGASYNLATGLGSVDGAVLVSSWTGGGAVAGADFALTESASAGTVLAGKSTSFTINATESGTAKNSVALTVSAPSGVTATVSPASITPGTAATVTVSVGSTVAAGAQTISISGKDASGTQSLSYALTVTAQPTLALGGSAASSGSVSIAQGATGTVALTATTGGSFTGALTYSITGLPTGVTAGWSANPTATVSGAGTSPETLTLTVSNSAAVASTKLTITVAGDGLTATFNTTVQVLAGPAVQLSASPTAVSVQSLSSVTATLTATPSGGAVIPAGASGSSISVTSGLPKGFTATFGTASLTSAGNAAWTLTLTGSSSAVAGTSTLGISAKVAAKSGTVYTVTANLPLTVTLTPPALIVTPAAASVVVNQGGNIPVSIALTGNATYAGAATMSVSGLPSGITAAWSANPVTLNAEAGSSTLTLTASASAPLATSTLTVTATGDGVSGSKQFSLQVQQAPGVTLGASATAVSMQSLASTTATFTATPVGGVVIPAGASGSSIAVSSGLPKGVTAAWSPASLTSAGAATWTLTLTGSSTAVAGVSTLGVTAKVVGKSGSSYTAAQNLALTVTVSPPTLTMTPAAASVAVVQGAKGTVAVALAGNGTYTGAVTLSTSGLPSGVTASWSSNPVTLSNESGSSTLTLTASSTAPVSTATITVYATGDSLSVNKQISVQVQQAPGISLGASSSAVSMQSLATTTAVITATPLGGVVVPTGATGSTINVASGLPKGVTASWSAATVTSAGAVQWTLTLKGSSTAVAGSATLAITANVAAKTGSAYSASQNLGLTVTLSPPTLTGAVGSSSVVLSQGSTATEVLTLTGNGTYAGPATPTVTGLPTGVTAVWSKSPVTLNGGTGTSTLTLSATSAAVIGSKAFTITATGDGVTATSQVTLQVQKATSAHWMPGQDRTF